MQLFLTLVELLLIPNLESLRGHRAGELIAEPLRLVSLLLYVLLDLIHSLLEALIRLDVALEHTIFFVLFAIVIFSSAHLVLLA